jgi:uncharacterized protein YqfB (UPF0267 family)
MTQIYDPATIEIPFSNEMQEAVIQGRKICTTRKEAKGRAGDLFRVRGQLCRILSIQEIYLDVVSDVFFRCEGCESPDEFRDLWRRLHRGHYSGQKRYYVHFFAIVPNVHICQIKEQCRDNPALSA